MINTQIRHFAFKADSISMKNKNKKYIDQMTLLKRKQKYLNIFNYAKFRFWCWKPYILGEEG